MTDPHLHAAWVAVTANTPGGWFVGQPGYEDRYQQWSMFAFDPSEPAAALTLSTPRISPA